MVHITSIIRPLVDLMVREAIRPGVLTRTGVGAFVMMPPLNREVKRLENFCNHKQF